PPALPPFPTRRSSDLPVPAVSPLAWVIPPPLTAAFAETRAYVARTVAGRELVTRQFKGLGRASRPPGVSLDGLLQIALQQACMRSEEHTSELQSRVDL